MALGLKRKRKTRIVTAQKLHAESAFFPLYCCIAYDDDDEDNERRNKYFIALLILAPLTVSIYPNARCLSTCSLLRNVTPADVLCFFFSKSTECL